MLFKTTHEIKEFVNGLDASVNFSNLKPALLSAERYIQSTLTQEVFESAVELGELLLKEAVANMAMYNYIIYDSLEKRKQGHDMYKYELETLRSDYLNNYQGALSELMRWFDRNSDVWQTSSFSQLRSSLLVQDVQTFNKYYPINNSYYFFTLLVPVQAEILDTYFKGVDYQSKRDNSRLCRACVLLTLSKALERFDFSILPINIRNSAADGAYRNASTSEDPAMSELSYKLKQDGLQALEEAKTEANPTHFDSNADKDYNTPTAKFFFI